MCLLRTAGQPGVTGGEPTEARRQRTAVSVFQGSIEIQIPLSDVVSLIFDRHPVTTSPLPPYVAPRHFRHSVTAVLTTGEAIDADYVNLGATVLRGTIDGRRVEIPWEEIAVLRFAR